MTYGEHLLLGDIWMYREGRGAYGHMGVCRQTGKCTGVYRHMGHMNAPMLTTPHMPATNVGKISLFKVNILIFVLISHFVLLLLIQVIFSL